MDQAIESVEAASGAKDGENANANVGIEAGGSHVVPPNLVSIVSTFPQVMDFIQFGAVIPALLASKPMRTLLSSLMTVRVVFDSYAGSQIPAEMQPLVERRRKEDRLRLPVMRSRSPKISLHFSSRSSLIRRKDINRALIKIMRVVYWEDCGRVELTCHGEVALLDGSLRSSIVALSPRNVPLFLAETRWFRRLDRLTLSFTELQSLCLDPDFSLPQVQKLTLTCSDPAFADSELFCIHQAFPNAEQLHLVLAPEAFPIVCGGPHWVAPRDFQISILHEILDKESRSERDATFFVGSHLLNLPFNWMGQLFSKVVRLQMSELNVDHRGKAMEQLLDRLNDMPLLRRVGTLSLRSLTLLNFTSESSMLEELVAEVEADEVEQLFKLFLTLETENRRCSIRRLAIHLSAPHGVFSLNSTQEAAVCAGWFGIANLMHPNAFIVLSTNSKQLPETVHFQLPWVDANIFTTDMAFVATDKLPKSTPLRKSLDFPSTEFLERPNGTLVAGELRPSSSVSWLGPNATPHVGRVQPLMQSPSLWRSHGSVGHSVDRSWNWVNWNLEEALKALSHSSKHRRR